MAEKYFMRKAIILSALLSVVALSGCANQKAWTYRADPYVKMAPLLNKSVSVPPLADLRENINHNMSMMYLIPLMPVGWQNLNTPEGVQMHMNSGLWIFKPTEDFAKAIAEELNNTSMFKEVFFTHRPMEADLALKGKIISTKYDGYLISYGLSAYGPLLWFFCFPINLHQ